MRKPFTILLVEDDLSDANLVRAALAASGGSTTLQHVENAVVALDYLSQTGERFAQAVRPDLILLDLNLPLMDGREFLERVKQDPALKAIPVVVLSTSIAERDTLRSYDLGVGGYVVKPADVNQFMEEIRLVENYWRNVVQLPDRQS
jgi:CheY-like chemotaxis protein